MPYLSGSSSRAAGVCTWSGWSGVTSATKTLSMTIAAFADSGGTCSQTVAYTLDGSTWTTLFTSTTTVASASYSATVPSGTNLANVQVRAQSSSVVSGGAGAAYMDAELQISNLQIA